MPYLHAPEHEADDRLELLRLLLADRDWQCAPPARRQLAGLLADPPVVRETVWELLAEELAAYLAFRKRWTAACHRPGPGAGCRFTREQWEHECRQQAA
ncbi:MAG TPA: hypothetical protein PK743_06470 [Luteimonas sp.]|nr:hypothetical protein [Luteimonas sp.]HRO28443.1 hypothetical protein [Luteimonas sp.]HRP72259.1 hypothetical protein [Luteimonas sp.]